MCVVVTKTELDKKNHTTAGIIFCLTNTCAQIWQQGPGRADRQGDVFRSSFLSPLDSTTLPKGGGGEVGCQVVVWCTLSLVLAQNPCILNAFFGNSAVFP